MIIGKDYILVRVNGYLQKDKRSRIGSILLHQNYIHMERNLQFGTIEQIGSNAAKQYPMARVGYEVTFHHTIEDADDRLLEVDAINSDKLLYLVASATSVKQQNFEIYGFFSPDGELIPSPHYVWMHPDVKPIKRKLASEYLHLETDMDGSWDDPDRIDKIIEELRWQWDNLQTSILASRYTTEKEEHDRKMEVVKAMNKLHDECAMLTALKSKPRLGIGKAIAINSELKALYPNLGVGSQLVCHLPLYPLDIYNDQDPNQSAQFLLVRNMDIVGYLN